MRHPDRKPGVRLVTDPAPSTISQLTDETIDVMLGAHGVIEDEAPALREIRDLASEKLRRVKREKPRPCAGCGDECAPGQRWCSESCFRQEDGHR